MAERAQKTQKARSAHSQCAQADLVAAEKTATKQRGPHMALKVCYNQP
jgi:hypothetical protein